MIATHWKTNMIKFEEDFFADSGKEHLIIVSQEAEVNKYLTKIVRWLDRIIFSFPTSLPLKCSTECLTKMKK